MFGFDKSVMPTPDAALPGRAEPQALTNQHFVHGRPLQGPFPDGLKQVVFGMGCFWGAERVFWSLPGVYTTAVGYAGGFTPNPTYREVCTARTGHFEAVLVVYEPEAISLRQLLTMFWESHDPTQGMRQGNDRGTEYRSAIYVADQSELELVQETVEQYQALLEDEQQATITTEIGLLKDFYYADDSHQQYLAKNPNGYCGLGGTGVCFPPE